MPYIWCIGSCYGCGGIFQFHPDLVPSLPVDGVRQPICKVCVTRANPLREENGMPPIEILPGAYEPGPDHV